MQLDRSKATRAVRDMVAAQRVIKPRETDLDFVKHVLWWLTSGGSSPYRDQLEVISDWAAQHGTAGLLRVLAAGLDEEQGAPYQACVICGCYFNQDRCGRVGCPNCGADALDEGDRHSV